MKKAKTEKRLLFLQYERASSPGHIQTGLGPRFYSFTIPAGYCTDSDGVEPASGFINKNRQPPAPFGAQCRLRIMPLASGLRFIQWLRTFPQSSATSFLHGRMK